MAPAPRTAPTTVRHRIRLVAALLAAVLTLLTGAGAHTAAGRRAVAVTTAGGRPHRSADTTARRVVRTARMARRTFPIVASPTSARIQLQPGDTLWELARRYLTTVVALQKANHLGASTLIYAGAHLTVPLTDTARAHADSAARRRAGTDSTGRSASGGAAAIAFAMRQLGTPYLWGGTGEAGYDCSGLVRAAWHAAGVDLPRTATAQASAGMRISRHQLRPGDLVFTGGLGHVQLYTGIDRVIEAAHTGTVVRYAPLPSSAVVDAYVRVRTPRVTAPATGSPVNVTAPVVTARQSAALIFGTQYACAAAIITRESGWNTTATNPSSGAYGLAQALPATKMAAFGAGWRTAPAPQLRWMRSYVNSRYGGACAAWHYWQTHHWY